MRLMVEKKSKNLRLPRNFHKTFIPERQYIHAMMRFAAGGQVGDYQQISSVTGIPMGKSSGKVPSILDYCIGMGLISLVGEERSAVKMPELTPFGRIVFKEDPHIKERITQWVAHFNLCRINGGADVWYYTFVESMQILGPKFARKNLEEYLSFVYKTKPGGLIGPLVRMYEDDAAFRICGALSESNESILRNKAPIADEFSFAYSAWLLQMIYDHFPNQGQITVTELDKRVGWLAISGWDFVDSQRVLALVERKGMIMIDRHMSPWILHPVKDIKEAWSRLYGDLI